MKRRRTWLPGLADVGGWRMNVLEEALVGGGIVVTNRPPPGKAYS